MDIIDIVGYGNNKTEKLCNNRKYATKELGGIVAEKLDATLNFIKNSVSLADIAFMSMYHLHELKGNRNKQFSLDIAGRKSNYRLIIVPNPPLCNEEDKLDFSSKCKIIKCIVVLEVSNHYE